MKNDVFKFDLPGRLDARQAAERLGFDISHIPILIAKRLLKPLGKPPINSPKYFAREYVARLAADEAWLSKSSDALVAHWRDRNSLKKKEGET